MKKNQPSSTAFIVSQAILYTAQRPEFENFVPADLVEATQNILATSVEGRKRLRQIDSLWFKMRTLFWEHLVIPGIGLHYVMRKRFIEEITVQAISEGFTQIVNLGAGLDTLALRLHQQYPKVTFIEVDYPSTCAEKSAAITQILTPFEAQSSNFHLLPADLRQKVWLKELIELKSFDPNEKTLLICEGVLMYLKEASAIELFLSLQNLTLKESKIIFTCVEPMQSKNNNVSFLLKFFLKFKGEPLCWVIQQDNLPSFLNDRGYKIQTLVNSKTFAEHYLKNYKFRETLHQGEYIGIAQIP